MIRLKLKVRTPNHNLRTQPNRKTLKKIDISKQKQPKTIDQQVNTTPKLTLNLTQTQT